MADERVEHYLTKGLDCGQTVFSCFADELGFSEEDTQKIASGFGGGMFTGETCGAVAGAIMVLGMKYGFSVPVDQGVKALCREKVMEFKRRFTEKRGSCICSSLLGVDMSTEAGHAEAVEKGLLAQICPEIITDAVEILEDMFDED